VQIDCNRPGEAVLLLQDLPGVLGANIHGALVHLNLEKSGVEPKIKKALANAGIKVNSWEVIQPSLEDVFLSMVSEQLSGNPFQEQEN